MEIAEGNKIRVAGQTVNQIILVGCSGMDLEKFESADAFKFVFLDKLPRISTSNRFHSIFISEEWIRSNNYQSLKKFLNHYDRYALFIISDKQDIDLLTFSQDNLVEDFIESAVCIPQVLIKLTELAEKKRNYSVQMLGQSHEISLYKRALDQSASAIEITDANGVIVYVNGQFEESSGYTASELVGKKASIVASGRMDGLFFQNLWETISSGKVWKGDFENRRKDGTLFYQRSTIRPVQRPDGLITHYIAIKDDIQSIQENELTKEFIINAANIATWDWHIDKGQIDYNDQWASLIGFGQKELGSKKGLWQSLLHPDDKARVLRVLDEHLELKSEQYDAIYRLKHKDGHYVWVHDSGKVIATDKNGKATRMAGVHVDVTDLMTTQEALSIERDQLAQTQQVAQTGSCFFDFKQECFTYFSDVARELVMLPESGDIQFDQVLSKIPLEEIEMVKGHYEKMLKGEHIHLFHRVLHDEGFMWLKIDGTPVEDSNGEAIGLLAVLQDVTDLKTQIKTISDQNQKLQEANALAKMGHWKLNLKTNTCVWSDQLMIIMGVEGDKNEFTFDEYLKIIHPEDQKRAVEEYQYA